MAHRFRLNTLVAVCLGRQRFHLVKRFYRGMNKENDNSETRTRTAERHVPRVISSASWVTLRKSCNFGNSGRLSAEIARTDEQISDTHCGGVNGTVRVVIAAASLSIRRIFSGTITSTTIRTRLFRSIDRSCRRSFPSRRYVHDRTCAIRDPAGFSSDETTVTVADISVESSNEREKTCRR